MTGFYDIVRKAFPIPKVYICSPIIIPTPFMVKSDNWVDTVFFAQSCPALCDPMTIAHQIRKLEWAAFPSPGDLPDPGIKPKSPKLQADS